MGSWATAIELYVAIRLRSHVHVYGRSISGLLCIDEQICVMECSGNEVTYVPVIHLHVLSSRTVV